MAGVPPDQRALPGLLDPLGQQEPPATPVALPDLLALPDPPAQQVPMALLDPQAPLDLLDQTAPLDLLAFPATPVALPDQQAPMALPDLLGPQAPTVLLGLPAPLVPQETPDQ